MASTARVIVMALAFMASAQAAAQSITEASVQEFLARLDRAIAAKNAVEVGKLISDNAQISASVIFGGRVKSAQFNKAQYVAAMRDSWVQGSNHTYRRTNQEIALAAGKATVTADVFESAIWQGHYVAVKTREVWTLEQVNGVLLLTGVVAKGTARGAQ